MSELINNREYRQKKLKELIMRLHDGESVESVKEDFARLTVNVSATEITEMEQALVNEGMPVSEIQRLCDVHAEVFKGSIEDIHAVNGKEKDSTEDGHPIETLKKENRAIETVIDTEVLVHAGNYMVEPSDANRIRLLSSMQKLQTIDVHYSRKENHIFPYMERHGITAPPQVMWGVDDEIRTEMKAVIDSIETGSQDAKLIRQAVLSVVTRIRDMIFKEEEIMIPMIRDLFTKTEWADIEQASREAGYTLIEGVAGWIPQRDSMNEDKAGNQPAKADAPEFVAVNSETKISFDAGMLTAEELNSILNTVPFDMTFVGADNRVRYFTQGKERIFERPLTIIGREVKYCHPPKSVHVVEKIVEDLRSGRKDHEDFWIRMGEAFVYIRYFAVRNKENEFLGVLEVSQNIKPITELEGEKRLMS